MTRAGSPPPLRPIDAPRSTAMSMLRALTHRPGRPGPDTVVPAHGVHVPAWPMEQPVVSSYREVVGSTASLPVLVPAVPVTRLHRDLMGLGRLPVNAMGMVHVGSRIEVEGRLPATGVWQVEAWAGDTRHTAAGLELDLWGRCQGGGAQWTAQVIVLVRSKVAAGYAESAGPRIRAQGPWEQEQTLEVPVDAGWAYARVSGDYNPIHLNLLTAKPFGFDRAIAHGWWSLARALAVLDLDETPDSGRRSIEVTYRRPVLLPSTPQLVSRSADDAVTLALLRPDGREHIAATVR